MKRRLRGVLPLVRGLSRMRGELPCVRGVRRRLRGVLPVAALLLCSACLPDPATSQARQTAGLYQVFIGAAIVVFVLVWSLLTWSVLRYRVRRRPGPDASDLPPQTRGNTLLEAIWTGIPIVTIAVLFLLTVGVLNTLQARSAQPAARVDVTAFRWGWTFAYPDEGISVIGDGTPGPEAVVPAGGPILFTIGALDVVHSFYVPAFLAKYDAVPGRTQQVELTIEQPGSYGGQCAEFCGLLHDDMPFTIRAVSPADYRSWVASQRASGSPGAGSTP